MATKKQLEALKKARAARAKKSTATKRKTTKKVVSKKKTQKSATKCTSKLSGTGKEWIKTNNPLFIDYKVIVGNEIKKIFGSLKEAKKYAEKLKTKKDISITEVTIHNSIKFK